MMTYITKSWNTKNKCPLRFGCRGIFLQQYVIWNARTTVGVITTKGRRDVHVQRGIKGTDVRLVRCSCPEGYKGDRCQTGKITTKGRQDVHVQRGIKGTDVRLVRCSCPEGYKGDRCQTVKITTKGRQDVHVQRGIKGTDVRLVRSQRRIAEMFMSRGV